MNSSQESLLRLDFDTLKAKFLLANLKLTVWVTYGNRWLWFTREKTYSNRGL